MPRQKDLSEIPTDYRTFIKTKDWENGETRQYYYTGYEEAQRMSKAGAPYKQYLVYLLPIEADGSHGEEVTLSIFPNQMRAFKEAALQDYQEIAVTKIVSPGTNGYDREDYEVAGHKNILPEADRPAEKDYPEMKETAPRGEESYAPKPAAVSADEIDISDIPF